MKKYSDLNRIDIVKEGYERYKIKQPIILEKGKKTVGYVSDYKDKKTGEQTYIVTDKRLSENPTYK